MLKRFSRHAVILALILTLAVAITGTLFIGGENFSAAYAANEDNKVFLGGIPIGINAKSEQLIVSEIFNVTTKDGSYSPALQSGILKGDIIMGVNAKKISDISEFNDIVNKAESEVILTVKRGENLFDVIVNPAFDIAQNAKKIGLLVKNEINGIGTLTFMNKNNYYGALGHMIMDGFGNGGIYSSGTVYKCSVTGFQRATENEAGELRGRIDYSASVGTINKNIFCGIYGEINENALNLPEIELGRRDTVKSGKAQIYTTINGELPQFYDIEIIKAIKQKEPSDKGLVIRVTDKELKKTTGGILQGMSGSPIIQNGKLVGAVTHVFTTDSTKGYGIYIDWMLPNAN